MIIQKTTSVQVKTSYKAVTLTDASHHVLPSYTVMLLKLRLDLRALCNLRYVFVFINKFILILTNK